MRVLLTNDDGIAAPGIAALIRAVVEAGHGVDGPPALAVMMARLGAFGDPPEVVISGVNPGANTGRAPQRP